MAESNKKRAYDLIFNDIIMGSFPQGVLNEQKLIERYGSIEAVLDHAPADQKGKLRERLIEGRESALLSKRLAAIDRAVPIDIKPSDCPLRDIRDGRDEVADELMETLERLMR